MARLCLRVLLDQQHADAGRADVRQRREQLACTAAATGRATARRAAGSRAPTSARGRSPASAARRRSWCRTFWLDRSARRGNRPSTRRSFAFSPGARALADRRRAPGSPAPSGRQRCRAPPAPARCRLRRSRAAAAPRSMPSSVIEAPGRGATRPAMALSSVDLPAPLAPRITTISPARDIAARHRQAPGACRRRRRGRATSSIVVSEIGADHLAARPAHGAARRRRSCGRHSSPRSDRRASGSHP